MLAFAAAFGGVEHDSGWYLGVARNLATRGIYASYTNTIRDDTPGWHPSIHFRFSVQDEDGFSYFPAGVTAGPGYILPEALVLKLFGDGLWQYRFWPLLAFSGLLGLAFFLALRVGGLSALMLFQVWLWSVPQMTTPFAYEAFSEHVAVLFLLAAFMVLGYPFSWPGRLSVRIAITGFLMGLAIATKQVSALALGGLLPLLAWQIYREHPQLKTVAFHGLVFAGSLALPLVAYEVYRFVAVTERFGIEAWFAINEDRRLHAQSAGSGLDLTPLIMPHPAFMLDKLDVWRDVALDRPGVAWIGLLLVPLICLRGLPRPLLPLALALWSSIAVSFVWFVLLSPTGWARHAWHSLFLGMLLLSVAAGVVLRKSRISWKGLLPAALVGVTLISVGVRYPSIELRPIMDQSTIDRWHELRHLRGLGRGFPSTPLLPLTDQLELVAFFGGQIHPRDRVYYLEGFLNAEVSPQVDKVFYSLERYRFIGQRNDAGGESYLIIGPYEQGTWRVTSPDYLESRTGQYCADVVFSNPSYLLCRLRAELP